MDSDADDFQNLILVRPCPISSFCVKFLTNNQTDKLKKKQTDKHQVKHNLLGGGNKWRL